jgi:hypothetical protein
MRYKLGGVFLFFIYILDHVDMNYSQECQDKTP